MLLLILIGVLIAYQSRSVQADAITNRVDMEIIAQTITNAITKTALTKQSVTIQLPEQIDGDEYWVVIDGTRRRVLVHTTTNVVMAPINYGLIGFDTLSPGETTIQYSDAVIIVE